MVKNNLLLPKSFFRYFHVCLSEEKECVKVKIISKRHLDDSFNQPFAIEDHEEKIIKNILLDTCQKANLEKTITHNLQHHLGFSLVVKKENAEKLLFQFKKNCKDFFHIDLSKHQIICHLDVNGTLIVIDPIQGKEKEQALHGLISEKLRAQWEPELMIMSYKKYIKSHLITNKGEPDRFIRKQKRKEYAGNFLKKIEKTHPEIFQLGTQFIEEFNKKISVDSILFSSSKKFFQTIAQDNLNIQIVLRTFGGDLEKVANSIQKIFKKNKIRTQIIYGLFDEHGFLHIEEKIYREAFEIKNYFIQLTKNNTRKIIAIQDHYLKWLNNKGGKPFILDPHEFQRQIFFDDNIFHKKIIEPLTTEKINIPYEELLLNGHAINVNTIEAILDEDYFLHQLKYSISLPR